jgi:hypothetical protein
MPAALGPGIPGRQGLAAEGNNHRQAGAVVQFLQPGGVGQGRERLIERECLLEVRLPRRKDAGLLEQVSECSLGSRRDIHGRFLSERPRWSGVIV